MIKAMSLVNRYILREMAVPLGIGLVSLVTMTQFLYVVGKLEEDRMAPTAIFEASLYKVPDGLKLAIPSALAFATAMAMYRLSRDSEFVAMRAAGLRLGGIAKPILLVGLVFAILSFVNSEWVRPMAESKVRAIELSAPAIDEFQIYERPPNRIIYFANPDPMGSEMLFADNLTIIDRPNPSVKVVTHAARALFQDDKWYTPIAHRRVFIDGKIQGLETTPHAMFRHGVRRRDILQFPWMVETPLSTLKEEIRAERAAGRTPHRLETELHARFALPASSVILALAGMLLGLAGGRSASLNGLMIGGIVAWAYLNVFVIATEIIGKEGWLPPMVAAWVPNVLFAGCILVVLRKLR